jgi:hypothetical protein
MSMVDSRRPNYRRYGTNSKHGAAVRPLPSFICIKAIT